MSFVYGFRGLVELPATSRVTFEPNGWVSHQRAPTDAVSFPEITFTGVALNTEIRFIRTSDNVELAGVENYNNDSFTVPHYGSGLSEVRIQFINTDYEFISLLYDVLRFDVSLPIPQRKNRIFNDPP